jgi:superfamily I DNA/RNA helicase
VAAPNPEQIAAIDEPGVVFVSAGAGTGKTTVLVERFVKAVCERGLSIDSVLVITYTKRTAGELRGRIRAALRERGREEVGTRDLGGSSDHASFARQGIPAGGIFTGLGRCYHRACDDEDNVDPRRVADAAAATAATLLELRSP